MTGTFFEPHLWNSGNLLLFSRCTNRISITFWIFKSYKSCKKCWSLPLQVFRASCFTSWKGEKLRFLWKALHELNFINFPVFNHPLDSPRQGKRKEWKSRHYRRCLNLVTKFSSWTFLLCESVFYLNTLLRIKRYNSSGMLHLVFTAWN